MKKVLIGIILAAIFAGAVYSGFEAVKNKPKPVDTVVQTYTNVNENTTNQSSSSEKVNNDQESNQAKSQKNTDTKVATNVATEKTKTDVNSVKTNTTTQNVTKDATNNQVKSTVQNTTPDKKQSVSTSADKTNSAKPVVESQPKSQSETSAPIVPKQIYVTPYNVDGANPIMSVQSNSQINSVAQEITKNDTTDLEKAKSIYDWITQNISYNAQLESEVEAGTNTQYSVGAINTFNTRSGICYGYSTLFVAMANDVGLNVELIGGDILNNGQWQDHAWNRVLCNGNWVNIDCTYGVKENEFNTSNFNSTHKMTLIEGHWE